MKIERRAVARNVRPGRDDCCERILWGVETLGRRNVRDAYSISSGITRDKSYNIERISGFKTPLGNTYVEFDFSYKINLSDGERVN